MEKHFQCEKNRQFVATCWDWLSCTCLRSSFILVAWTLLDNSGEDFKAMGKLLMDSVTFLDYKG